MNVFVEGDQEATMSNDSKNIKLKSEEVTDAFLSKNTLVLESDSWEVYRQRITEIPEAMGSPSWDDYSWMEYKFYSVIVLVEYYICDLLQRYYENEGEFFKKKGEFSKLVDKRITEKNKKYKLNFKNKYFNSQINPDSLLYGAGCGLDSLIEFLAPKYLKEKIDNTVLIEKLRKFKNYRNQFVHHSLCDSAGGIKSTLHEGIKFGIEIIDEIKNKEEEILSAVESDIK